MIKYEQDGKIAWFDGKKYTRDDKTNYYLNSTNRKRLHRAVWEFYNGEIPSGYDIHHDDRDKHNNDISNLVLITRKKHLHKHGQAKYKNETEWFKLFHSKGIESAKQWHKSKEGHEWHKAHYEKFKDNFCKDVVLECEYCGEKFEAKNNGQNRFCSNKCKSAWRRREGLDDEQRICECCGKEYTANKYSKKRTCSKTCSNRLFPRLPQLRKD